MAAPSFEKDLERLEKIVEALEQGELSLDESLKRFEEGIRLARRCEKALVEAEKRIEILMKDAQGNIQAQPFGAEAEGDASVGDVAEDEESTKDEGADAEEDASAEEEGGLLF